MSRRMWVFIVLLLVGGAIVVVRLFRNGAGAEDGLEAPKEPAAPRARAAAPAARPAPAAVTAHRAQKSPAPAPSGPAPSKLAPAWPGGDCPACGSPTVRAAKFCGECGRRLVP